MHPEIGNGLELIKDCYSLLLKIIVESSSRQNSILKKQVDLLTRHNDKLKQTAPKAHEVNDLQREKEKNVVL